MQFLVLATAETKEEVKEAPKAAAPAKKPPAKAPAKPLPQMMEEDVIPSLKSIFEAQEDFSNIELVFKDNKVALFCKNNVSSFTSIFLLILLIFDEVLNYKVKIFNEDY